MKIKLELELTDAEVRMIGSMSLERVLNNAIHVGGEAQACADSNEPATGREVERWKDLAERGSTLWQDCEELKPVTMKIWNAVHNAMFEAARSQKQGGT